MAWEVDSEEVRLRKQNDEINKIRENQFFINTGIGTEDSGSNIGTSQGLAGFNFGAIGDALRTAVNDFTTGIGEIDIFGSLMKIFEAPSGEPTVDCATVTILRGGGKNKKGVVGQRVTLKADAGKTLCLIDNNPSNASTDGNLMLGQDITISDTQLITLRYQEDVTYSDSTATEIIGGWILENSTGNGGGGSGGGSTNALKQQARTATTLNYVDLNLVGETIDNVTTVEGDRVLVRAQSNAEENGIYVMGVITVGVGALTRATDFDDDGEVKSGVLLVIEEGDTYKDTLWNLITDNDIEVGVTNQIWALAGDNLGNHIAITDLDMSTFDILQPDRIFWETEVLIRAVDTTATDGTLDRLEYDAGNLGAHDFYVDRSVTTIPRFGITETALQSNVELIMNTNDISGVDRFVLDTGGTGSLKGGVTSPEIYISGATNNPFVFNYKDTDGVFLWTHDNVTTMQHTADTTQIQSDDLTRFKLHKDDVLGVMGTVATEIVFSGQQDGGGNRDYAFISGIIEDDTIASIDGGLAIQIMEDNSQEIYMQFNTLVSNQIDILRDVNMSANDVFEMDRAVWATVGITGVPINDTDKTIFVDGNDDFFINNDTDQFIIMSLSNVTAFAINEDAGGNFLATLQGDTSDINSNPILNLNILHNSPHLLGNIGTINWNGNRVADLTTSVNYSAIVVQYEDTAIGTRSASMSLQTYKGGTIVDWLEYNIGNTGTIEMKAPLEMNNNLISNIGGGTISDATDIVTVDGATDFLLIFDDSAPTNLKKVLVNDMASGFQTPWETDIDADGFDLFDLANIEFRDTTGAPIGTDTAIWRENAGDLHFNVPSAKEFLFEINDTIEYTMGAGALIMGGNNLGDVDSILFDTSIGGVQTISPISSGIEFRTADTNDFSFWINGNEEWTIGLISEELDAHGNNLTSLGNLSTDLSGRQIIQSGDSWLFQQPADDNFIFTVDGSPVAEFDEIRVDLYENLFMNGGHDIRNVNAIQFSGSTGLTKTTEAGIEYAGNLLHYNVPLVSADSHTFEIDGEIMASITRVASNSGQVSADFITAVEALTVTEIANFIDFTNGTPFDGDIWYDDVSNEFKFRENGVTNNLSGAGALNDLSDVTLTSPATGAVLIKTAGDWVDNFITDSSISTGVFASITGLGTQTQALVMGGQIISGVGQIAFAETDQTITDNVNGMRFSTGGSTDSFDFTVDTNLNISIEKFFINMHNSRIQMAEETVPSNAPTNEGFIFLSSATGELSIIKDAGGAISLESGGSSFTDLAFDVHDDITPTKILKFSLAPMAVGTSTIASVVTTAVRTWSLPDITGVFIMGNGSQTLAGLKTFNSTIIAGNGTTAISVTSGPIDMNNQRINEVDRMNFNTGGYIEGTSTEQVWHSGSSTKGFLMNMSDVTEVTIDNSGNAGWLQISHNSAQDWPEMRIHNQYTAIADDDVIGLLNINGLSSSDNTRIFGAMQVFADDVTDSSLDGRIEIKMASANVSQTDPNGFGMTLAGGLTTSLVKISFRGATARPVVSWSRADTTEDRSVDSSVSDIESRNHWNALLEDLSQMGIITGI